MSQFEDAIKFAVDAHSGMVRKQGVTPFIVHPMEAAVIVSTLTDNQDVMAAAMLHDVVEDTDVTMEEIEERFGPRIAELVASETEDKLRDRPASETWRERKEASLERLRAASDDYDVKCLWLGDKLANMRSYYRQFTHRGHTPWHHFNQTDPAQQEWYYRTIAGMLEDLKDTEAWQEYTFLLDLVFEKGE